MPTDWYDDDDDLIDDELEDELFDAELYADADSEQWDDDEELTREQPTLEQTIGMLKDGKTRDSTLYYGLSGLSEESVQLIAPYWDALPARTRQQVMRQVLETSESNFELDYRTFAIHGLHDPDPMVRETAIETLWEDETLEVMRLLIAAVGQDRSAEVRAAAASALGRFILAGELGSIHEEAAVLAQNAIIAALENAHEEIGVRRRALEAIANCGHPLVEGAIRTAYEHSDPRMRISAVFAMGRTCDDRWRDYVLDELNSKIPEMLYEAVRAAGELELLEAVPTLGRLILNEDREVKETAVWSLGEIGGREAIRILEAAAEVAEENDDDDLLEAIEDALSNANFGSLGIGDL